MAACVRELMTERSSWSGSAAAIRRAAIEGIVEADRVAACVWELIASGVSWRVAPRIFCGRALNAARR